jgi:phage baseplate assembly protein V
MSNLAQLERRIAALEANRGAVLRFGSVTQVDAQAGTARVLLDDADNLVSMPLRVLQHRTLKDKHQLMPDLGEQVVCLFSGQGFEQGVILGAAYSSKDPAPGRPAQNWYYKFEDGTWLEYDRKTHLLTASVRGDVALDADKNVTAKAGESLEAEAGKDISMKAGQSISLTAPQILLNGTISGTSTGNINLSAGGNININGAQVEINNEGCE